MDDGKKEKKREKSKEKWYKGKVDLETTWNKRSEKWGKKKEKQEEIEKIIMLSSNNNSNTTIFLKLNRISTYHLLLNIVLQSIISSSIV